MVEYAKSHSKKYAYSFGVLIPKPFKGVQELDVKTGDDLSCKAIESVYTITGTELGSNAGTHIAIT
jgi:hypothetical protein